MFGYITPLPCELKVREFELFQAYYCGLCKELSAGYKKSSVLNYDCTFIYILGDSLAGGDAEAAPCSCMLHPFKKKWAVRTDSARYAAAVNVLMAYAKADDDVRDRGGMMAMVRRATLKRAFAKAGEIAPGVVASMRESADKLHALEAEKSANTDAAADTYAVLFGKVLQELDVVQSHILYDLGYSMGRWVYLIDAYDDIGHDMKHGEYNVFVNKYGIAGDIPEDVREQVRFNFNYTLSMAMDALKRLEIKQNRPLLENIVCLGMKERTKNILEGITDESLPGVGRRSKRV